MAFSKFAYLEDLENLYIDVKDKRMKCPYDKSHRVGRERFEIHLQKCRRNLEDAILKDYGPQYPMDIFKGSCKFNSDHRYHLPEIHMHEVLYCPDREKKLDVKLRFLKDEGGEKGKVTVLQDLLFPLKRAEPHVPRVKEEAVVKDHFYPLNKKGTHKLRPPPEKFIVPQMRGLTQPLSKRVETKVRWFFVGKEKVTWIYGGEGQGEEELKKNKEKEKKMKEREEVVLYKEDEEDWGKSIKQVKARPSYTYGDGWKGARANAWVFYQPTMGVGLSKSQKKALWKKNVDLYKRQGTLPGFRGVESTPNPDVEPPTKKNKGEDEELEEEPEEDLMTKILKMKIIKDRDDDEESTCTTATGSTIVRRPAPGEWKLPGYYGEGQGQGDPQQGPSTSSSSSSFKKY